MNKLVNWLKQLHHSLLKIVEWNEESFQAHHTLVTDIWQNWESITKQKPFPKLHMLYHTLSFPTIHQQLSQVSESAIESYHFQFNKILNDNHHNQGNKIVEKLRRTLADFTCKSIQPLL